MLGEIVKSTEALRYHAKSAEVAGKNLAHVNDENYARQRVLAREGLMYNGQGGLNTSSIEAGGLDHARNDLIDKRLFKEFGQTASLNSQEEILKLLQAALGEKVDRQSVASGLDDEHDSNLSAGGLARAMDDLFNAFQELSASPDAAVASQEIFNKIQTLTKRFNDAGAALDDIETDLTESVQSGVTKVNRLLEQIEEVNIQIRRFELLGQGMAVSYRDQRQSLLEDLSKLINFTTSPEIREDGTESPFLEVFTKDTSDLKVTLLSAVDGVKALNKEFGNVTLANSVGTSGNGLQIRSKVSNDGSLGHVEVLDGGAQYSDKEGPLLLTFAPPIVSEEGDRSLVNHQKNSLFSQNGKYYQALEDIPEGTPLDNRESFLEIDAQKIPANGDLTAYVETLRRYSDLETFKAGDQVYSDGKLLQVTRDVNPISISSGGLESRSYFQGEVVKVDGSYYQFLADVAAEDADLDAILGKSVLEIGSQLPQEVEEFPFFSTVLSDVGQRTFVSKSYDQGDLVKLFDPNKGENGGFRYFELTNPILREEEFSIGIDQTTDEEGNAIAGEYSWLLNKIGDESTNFAVEIDNPGLGLSKKTLVSNEAGGDVIEVEIDGVYEKSGVELNVVTARAQSIDEFKMNESPMRFRQNEVYFFEQEEGSFQHFVVIDPPEDVDPLNFTPTDDQWSQNFKMVSLQLVEEGKPEMFFKRAHPVGYDGYIEQGSLVELNLGVAEAVVNDGQITGFNILSQGSNLPTSDAVFVEGKELKLEFGSIKGYQEAKAEQINRFRTDLNTLVTQFVEEINEIYNPEDTPGEYLFGFDSILSRPVMGRNTLMEEEYGYFGREGDGQITLFREEVSMQLPTPESETFNIVNVTPVFPEDFEGQQYYVRGGDAAAIDFAPNSTTANFSYYASARRMQNVTMENDPSYSGEDKILGTEDDGRSYMMAYDAIPFRVEGLEEGSKLPILGDNFSFKALPSNPWNLATSLRIQDGLSANSIVASKEGAGGDNQIALKIAEMGDGSFIQDIALLNADLGNSLSDISDNLEHQQSIENVLLDQRRAVSSVSIDEEVADLMRFQRSFQASSRVLSTLDKMLEVVVMGLLK